MINTSMLAAARPMSALDALMATLRCTAEHDADQLRRSDLALVILECMGRSVNGVEGMQACCHDAIPLDVADARFARNFEDAKMLLCILICTPVVGALFHCLMVMLFMPATRAAYARMEAWWNANALVRRVSHWLRANGVDADATRARKLP